MQNEDLRIMQAKEGGIYLIGSLLSLVLLLWVNYNSHSILALAIAVLSSSYFIVRSIESEVFTIGFPLLSKYNKWKNLHSYFETTPQKTDKIHKFWSQQQTEMESPRKTAQFKQEEKAKQPSQDSTQKYFSNINIGEAASQRLRTNVVVHRLPETPLSKSSRKDSFGEKQVKSESFVKAMEFYIRTMSELQKKRFNKKTFEDRCATFHDEFSQKVTEVLAQSQQNLRSLAALLEEHFTIKITSDHRNLPQKLEPVSLDQALQHIKAFKVVKCLPWGEKNRMDQEQLSKLIDSLKKLVEERKRLDELISPLVKLKEQERKELVAQVEQQLEKRINGRALLTLLIEIYNSHRQNEHQRLNWPHGKPHNSGRFVVESEVGGSLHADLMLRDVWGKETVYGVKPGDQNFWQLLTMASQPKLKL